jgi:hypothetical protein
MSKTKEEHLIQDLNETTKKFIMCMVELFAHKKGEIHEEPQKMDPPNQAPVDEPLIPTADACQVLGISALTLQKMRLSREVPYYRQGRRYYYLRSELLASLKQSHTPREHGYLGRGRKSGRLSC